jgi:hypothetical protein
MGWRLGLVLGWACGRRWALLMGWRYGGVRLRMALIVSRAAVIDMRAADM